MAVHVCFVYSEGDAPGRAISSPRMNAGRKLAPPSSIEEDMPHAERAIEERNVTGDGSQYSMVRSVSVFLDL